MLRLTRSLAATALALCGVAGVIPGTAAMPAGAAVVCADNPSLVVNPVADAGCVSIAVVSATTLRIVSVELNPGWTYTVLKNGSNGRVEMRFLQGSTGVRRELRVEFGRTVIK